MKEGPMTRRLAVALACAALALGCSSPSTVAPTASVEPLPLPKKESFGVLLMAHGGSKEWNDAVLASVEPLRAKCPIEVSFGMADATTLEEGVRKLEAKGVRRIGVVRLFISGESFLDETEQIFGLRAGAPAKGEARHEAHGGHAMAFFRVPTSSSFALSTQGLADAEGMGKVLADRVAALSKDPSKEDVLVLAHGPGDDVENLRWLAKLEARADAIRTTAPFRRVQVETLREDWPEKRAAAERRIRAFVEAAKENGGRAIVIPFRVQGFGPYAKVLEGLDYVADGKGLLPHAEVTAWIEQQVVMLERGSFRTPER